MNAPETATSPLAQAPADRPTLQLEEWTRQGEALLFADRRLDEYEARILRGFLERVAMRAQAAGGIGMGNGTPQTDPTLAGGQPPAGPMDMNANSEDMYAGAGEPIEE